MPKSSTEVADVETVRIEPISLETVLWIDGRGRNVGFGCAKMLVGVGAGNSEAAEAGVGVGAVPHDGGRTRAVRPVPDATDAETELVRARLTASVDAGVCATGPVCCRLIVVGIELPPLDAPPVCCARSGRAIVLPPVV